MGTGKAVAVIRVVPLVVFTVVAVSMVRLVVDEDIQQAIGRGAASLSAYSNAQGWKDYIVGNCPRSSTRKKAGAGRSSIEPVNSSTRSSYVQVANETVGKLLEALRRNGSLACHNEVTAGFEFEGLPAREWWPVVIGTREALRFRIVSLAADGSRRCFGGDSYEADLSGERWKSRPAVEDLGDGTYAVTAVLLGDDLHRGDAAEEEEEEAANDDDDEEEEEDGDAYGFLAGPYVLTVSLLYSNFHSLDQGTGDHNTVDRAIRAMNKTVQMQVQAEGRAKRRRRRRGSPRSRCRRRREPPRWCGQEDMEAWRPAVAGRWTRAQYNRSCSAEPQHGRFGACFRGNCTAGPWCDGRLSRLESNGWAYSRPGCRFHIWDAADAWDCLSGRWLFFWGDSNLQDFIRNILLFALDHPPPDRVPVDLWTLRRDVDERFANPLRPEQTVRLSLAFNGGPVITQDYHGLHSMRDATYRQRLWNHYLNTPPTGTSHHDQSNYSSSSNSTSSNTSGPAAERPYAFIFNSGIHDGRRYYSLDKYMDAVDFAASFWEGLLATSPPEHIVLRWSVATATDIGRYSPSNPAKLEAFNQALLLRFYRSFPHLRLLDAFDLTFPFHYDHCCSDGGHYGRNPKYRHRPWFGKAYNQYFLDVMLVHMLLTSICPLPAT